MSEIPELAALRLERDIVSLYHRYAAGGGFLDMFEFSLLYTLPYWEFLEWQGEGVGGQRLAFIREGCLMLLVRLATQLAGSDAADDQARLAASEAALQRFAPGTDRERELAQTALALVEWARGGRALQESVLTGREMLEDEVVRDYFRGQSARLSRTGAAPGGSGAVAAAGAPAGAVPGAEAAALRLAQLLERAAQAHERFYSARDRSEATAAYAEAKDDMAAAIALARQLEPGPRVQELEARLAHWKSVFRQLWP